MTNFNEEQFDLIKTCAEKEDFSEWNNYIKTTKERIKLEGADFSNMIFTNVNFQKAYLRKASFKNSKINCVNFSETILDEVNFTKSEINFCSFYDARMQSSIIKNATVFDTDFNFSNITSSNLKKTTFHKCLFFKSCFNLSNLKGTKFISYINPLNHKQPKEKINFCGATFESATFSNKTFFDASNISLQTDFRTKTFHLAQYSPSLKQNLQYCNRRHNWGDLCDQNNFLALIIMFFWWHTDYGSSIKQIIKSFSIIVMLFSFIYYLFPSLIKDLEHCNIIQAIYFSFVTMTTLGYGDMYPSHNSIMAQCIVIIQVCYGYLLLGSLITLLSNLFFSDGPFQRMVIKHKKDEIIRESELYRLNLHIKIPLLTFKNFIVKDTYS